MSTLLAVTIMIIGGVAFLAYFSQQINREGKHTNKKGSGD